MTCFDPAFCLIKKTWRLALEHPDNVCPWWWGQGSPCKTKAASDAHNTHLRSEEWWYLQTAEIYSTAQEKRDPPACVSLRFRVKTLQRRKVPSPVLSLAQHSGVGELSTVIPTSQTQVGLCCHTERWSRRVACWGRTRAGSPGCCDAATKQRLCNAAAGCSTAGASGCFSLCPKPRPELCCLMAKAELALGRLRAVTARVCHSARKLQADEKKRLSATEGKQK